MEISDVVRELGEWAHTNFKDANPWEPLIGMAEEIGELAVALRAVNAQEDVIDAMGDILIYSIDFARRDEIDWIELQEKATTSLYFTSRGSEVVNKLSTPHGLLAYLNHHFGQLCHHYLKRHQGIRKNEDHPEGIKTNLMLVIRDIELYCVMNPMFHHIEVDPEFQWDLKNILFTTAGIVLKRDWTSEQLGGDPYEGMSMAEINSNPGPDECNCDPLPEPPSDTYPQHGLDGSEECDEDGNPIEVGSDG